jgi:hypothetical protein
VTSRSIELGMLAVSVLDAVIDRRRSVLVTHVMTLAGLGFLWLLRIEPSVWLLGGFVVCCAATLSRRRRCISSEVGRRRRSSAVSASAAALAKQLVARVGGLPRDWTGAYDAVISFSVVSLLIAMAPFLTLRSLRE